MTFRRILFGPLLILTASVALAGSWGDYDAVSFMAAQERGRPIVLQFVSEACGICPGQTKMLIDALQGPEFAEVAGFRVDCNALKEYCSAWAVNETPTVVLLRNKQLAGRSVSVSDEEQLVVFLRGVLPVHGRPGPRPSNRIRPAL